MIYNLKFFALIIVMFAVLGNAFRMQTSKTGVASLRMALADYREELAKTAATIAAPGKTFLHLTDTVLLYHTTQS